MRVSVLLDNLMPDLEKNVLSHADLPPELALKMTMWLDNLPKSQWTTERRVAAGSADVLPEIIRGGLYFWSSSHIGPHNAVGHGEFSEMVHKCVKIWNAEHPDDHFQYSSYQCNKNFCSKWHTDNNLAPALMVTLGGYKDGGLVVQHPTKGNLLIDNHEKVVLCSTNWPHKTQDYILEPGQNRYALAIFSNTLSVQMHKDDPQKVMNKEVYKFDHFGTLSELIEPK